MVYHWGNAMFKRLNILLNIDWHMTNEHWIYVIKSDCPSMKVVAASLQALSPHCRTSCTRKSTINREQTEIVVFGLNRSVDVDSISVVINCREILLRIRVDNCPFPRIDRPSRLKAAVSGYNIDWHGVRFGLRPDQIRLYGRPFTTDHRGAPGGLNTIHAERAIMTEAHREQ